MTAQELYAKAHESYRLMMAYHEEAFFEDADHPMMKFRLHHVRGMHLMLRVMEDALLKDGGEEGSRE